MAVSIKLDEYQDSWAGSNFSRIRFNYATSGDTVKVPTGCLVAAVLSTGAPTCTITAGATEDTVTLTGGTPGNNLVLVTRHSGGSASPR